MQPTNLLTGRPQRSRLSANWNRVVSAVGDMVFKERKDKLEDQVTTLTQKLRHAVEDGWKTRHHNRYRQVHVLLTYWAETDDPGFGADIAANKLRDVFQQRYRFDVQIWLIPSLDQPQGALAAKLSHFVQDCGKVENLLIFWYGGASKETRDGKGPITWFGEMWGGEVNSGIVPQILGSGKADVLTLYDCGNSLHGQSISGPILFEHLGASAFGSVSGFSRSLSFTKSLAQILDRPEVVACGISVLDIHRKLVNINKGCRPSSAFDREDGIMPSEGLPVPTARSWLSSDVLQSPVYCHISNCPPRSQGGARSIIISRLGYPLEAFAYENQGEEFKVEVKLRLRNNDIDVDRWKEWILNAPSEADQVWLQVN